MLEHRLTGLRARALWALALCLSAEAVWTGGVRAQDGSDASAVPRWEIEAAYEGTHRAEPEFRFQVRHKGEVIAGQNWEETTTSAGDDASAHRSAAGLLGGPSGDAEEASKTAGVGNPGGWAEDTDALGLLRFQYDWSSAAGGPDLFRVHWGDHAWDTPLGLDRLLGKLGVYGDIEMNATHQLDDLNLSVGLERPFFRLLDPGPTWAHYLVLGLDMERVSTTGAASTTHGNATVEAFWGTGWGWKRTVGPEEARRAAVSLATSGTGDESGLDPELGKLRTLVTSVAETMGQGPVSKLDDPVDPAAPVLTAQQCDALLPVLWAAAGLPAGSVLSFRAGGEGPEIKVQDGAALAKALEAQARWRSGLMADWAAASGAPAEDVEALRALAEVTYWDLLAVGVPEVGSVYQDVWRWYHKPDSYAGALKDAPETFLFALSADNWWTSVTTGRGLADYLTGYAQKHMGRSVPEWIFSLEAVGWAPLGGSEGYDFRGSIEPRLVWRHDGTSRWGVTANYKHGYERSTRTEELDDFFIGFDYATN